MEGTNKEKGMDMDRDLLELYTEGAMMYLMERGRYETVLALCYIAQGADDAGSGFLGLVEEYAEAANDSILDIAEDDGEASEFVELSQEYADRTCNDPPVQEQGNEGPVDSVRYTAMNALALLVLDGEQSKACRMAAEMDALLKTEGLYWSVTVATAKGMLEGISSCAGGDPSSVVLGTAWHADLDHALSGGESAANFSVLMEDAEIAECLIATSHVVTIEDDLDKDMLKKDFRNG
jgi:hypothetical protein